MAIPKPQPYPASRIKVGAVLYRAYSLVDDGKVETGFEEWVVRNIRARRNWGLGSNGTKNQRKL